MLNNDKADLVLGSDGSLYHINLLPGEVAETIILVGDPGRTEMVANFFDRIEVKKQNREITTITGYYKDKRLSVMSSGMGTDNIEIVINELDALFNIDLATGIPNKETTSLNLIRIGTSGALQKDIPVVNSYLVSEFGLGLDGLAYFYKDSHRVIDHSMTQEFMEFMNMSHKLPGAYSVAGSEELLSKVGKDWMKGITLTAPGFYAPQGRRLRLDVHDSNFIDRAQEFIHEGHRVTNFEMETSALYVLSSMLGHKALTVCNIIANRVSGKFDPDYKKSMKTLVEKVLDRLVEL